MTCVQLFVVMLSRVAHQDSRQMMAANYIPDNERQDHIIHESVQEDSDGTMNIGIEVVQGMDMTDGVLWVVSGDKDMPIGKLVTD